MSVVRLVYHENQQVFAYISFVLCRSAYCQSFYECVEMPGINKVGKQCPL